MNNNYKLIEQRHVDDVEGEVFLLEHIKSGAKVLKIANSDTNKTFCITFKTEPDDESGIPHILEHSVLNGSKKYPVKSPFDQLMKGSLSTFLNAMTGEELTMFPMASVSHKDYFNLMDVYLDAVFNPLIYSDHRILRQEGWRIEAKNADDPFRYTGVVYNEMKGNYSDPMCDVFHKIGHTLFPDNGYGLDSGGYPEAIPTLTQEHFEEYHRNHYRPENSYIFLYGDADFEKELQLLDEGYLSKYEKQGGNYDIKPQAPFKEMKVINSEYPAHEGSEEDGDTYNTLTFVTCDINTPYATGAFNVILDVLVSQESGAIKNALIDAGICTSIDTYVSNSQQCIVSFLAFDCKKDSLHEFQQVIDKVLRDVAANGLDKESVDAVLNRMEFALKESNDAQRGIKLNGMLVNSWIFGGNPIKILEQADRYEEFKKKVEEGFLEDLIRKYLIDNPHSLLASFAPKQGLVQEAEAKIQQSLDEYKASLSKEQIDQLVAENEELDRYQNTPDTPEALKTIPTLRLTDINPTAVDYPIEKDTIDGIPTLRHEYNTKGIIYLQFFFDMKALPMTLVPYASLMSNIIGLMPTKKHTFGELDNAINKYTGSCTAGYDLYSRIEGKTRQPFALFKFQGKSLVKNLAKMTDLLIEMTNETIFDDKDRLRDIVMRQVSEITMDINYNAYQYARDRMLSQYNDAGKIGQLVEGIDYYMMLKDLGENFEAKVDDLISKFNTVKSLLLNRDNLQCFVYCAGSDYQAATEQVKRYAAALDTRKTTYQQWTYSGAHINEAIIMPSKVQYVLKAYDLLDPQYTYSGTLPVLSKILSTDYLQTNVRVRGGAYGSWGGITPDGIACLSSYRDPNLQNTIDVYDNIPGYLANFDADDDAMTKYIIGTISNRDMPVATSQRGRTALSRYRQGFTFDQIQQERNEILATTAQQIRDLAPLMAKVRDHGTVCVLGGEEKIMESKDLFNNIIRI
ncbi:MAG: insulinase family protein [Bacteroidales bacterium]|nr:insulinase family protein [Bacteroidales bacterium]MBR4273324.1 insulinase family protein [Bacteroidales bacterium]